MTEQLKACRNVAEAIEYLEQMERAPIEGVGCDLEDLKIVLALATRPSPEADAVAAAWRALRQLEIGLSNDALDTLRAALARTPAQEGE